MRPPSGCVTCQGSQDAGLRCAGLGRVLDPASNKDDVAANTDVDIPMWMAQNLAARRLVQLMCGASTLRFAGRFHCWAWTWRQMTFDLRAQASSVL